MILEQLLDSLSVTVEPFARCQIGVGCCLDVRDTGWVTFHFVLAGTGDLRSEGGRGQRLEPGSVAIVPAGMPHRLRRGDGVAVTLMPQTTSDHSGLLDVRAHAAGDTDGVAGDELVIVCGELRALFGYGLGLFDLLDRPIVVDVSDSSQMRAIFELLLAESSTAAPGRRVMLRSLMNAGLIEIFRLLCGGTECRLPWLDALEDPQLAPALGALLAHPEADHSVDSLARLAAMSRSTFADTFRRCFGNTPMAFLRDIRLQRGAELLRDTKLPVDTVARRVGFGGRSHFSRAFQAKFGEPPSTFRLSEPTTPQLP
jgi:AraC-like DNA-binding protein